MDIVSYISMIGSYAMNDQNISSSIIEYLFEYLFEYH